MTTSDLLSLQGKRSRADRGTSGGVSFLRTSPHSTHRHPEEESPPFRGTLRTGNELQGVQSLNTAVESTGSCLRESPTNAVFISECMYFNRCFSTLYWKCDGNARRLRIEWKYI